MNAAAGTLKSDTLGEIYFARPGKRQVVKIGWSVDVDSRMAALQQGSADELRLLGTVPGTLADELDWHARFADLRIRGEWFRLTGPLRDAISRRLEIAIEFFEARHGPLAEPTEEEARIERWGRLLHESRTRNMRRGGNHPNAKLDEAKVAAILADRRSLRAIAADYGVGVMTVQQIRARKTWRHVDPAPETAASRRAGRIRARAPRGRVRSGRRSQR